VEGDDPELEVRVITKPIRVNSTRWVVDEVVSKPTLGFFTRRDVATQHQPTIAVHDVIHHSLHITFVMTANGAIMGLIV